ncbi:hypothetical protein ACLKA6_014804 [Drosophila palustris]
MVNGADSYECKCVEEETGCSWCNQYPIPNRPEALRRPSRKPRQLPRQLCSHLIGGSSLISAPIFRTNFGIVQHCDMVARR